MSNHYLFTSERLGFRNWNSRDLEGFAQMIADPEVMRFFPQTQTMDDALAFIERQQAHFESFGFNYFAVETLNDQNFIGFIGLSWQDYPSPFNPAVDIGWRLKKSAWRKGYATEGAKRCMQFAFQELKLKKVIAVCPVVNKPSEAVMKKVGMIKQGDFKHPKLSDCTRLEECVWYAI